MPNPPKPTQHDLVSLDPLELLHLSNSLQTLRLASGLAQQRALSFAIDDCSLESFTNSINLTTSSFKAFLLAFPNCIYPSLSDGSEPSPKTP